MAAVFNDLIRTASGSQGQGEHIFQTDDTKAVVKASGYFNAFVDIVKVGDLIHVAGDLDGTPYTCALMVDANDGTTVTVIENAFTPFPGVILSFPNISTKAADAGVIRQVAPFAGTIEKISSVLNDVLATGDATLTAKIGATGVTGGVITITESGSAAGDVDSVDPTALNIIAEDDVISVTGGGASTATGTATVNMLILPT